MDRVWKSERVSSLWPLFRHTGLGWHSQRQQGVLENAGLGKLGVRPGFSKIPWPPWMQKEDVTDAGSAWMLHCTGQTPGATPLHHHFLQHQEVPSPGLAQWQSVPMRAAFPLPFPTPKPPRVPDFCTDCLVLLTHSKKFLWWCLQVPAHVGYSLGTYLCSFHFSMI